MRKSALTSTEPLPTRVAEGFVVSAGFVVSGHTPATFGG